MSAKGSELKRVRRSRKANLYNNHYKSMMKTSIKKVLASSSKDDASSLKNEAFKIIDKVASKGVIHKNKAANQKSRISRHLNSLS
ncbi:MAG: 30S ribosomal protein S20 [Candidatus Marinimicrobia bacterium]|nr:30S ribosomal protein S20 [Candidatus Neomarinimicrobiota bacterium]